MKSVCEVEESREELRDFYWVLKAAHILIKCQHKIDIKTTLKDVNVCFLFGDF